MEKLGRQRALETRGVGAENTLTNKTPAVHHFLCCYMHHLWLKDYIRGRQACRILGSCPAGFRGRAAIS